MKRDRVYLSKPDRLPFAPDQASALTRLMAVLESSFDGIFITDGQATPLWCNHSYEIISGLTAADVLGIPMAQLVDTGVISHSSTLKALNQGQAVTLEQTFTTGKQAVVTSTPIYDQDDNVCLVVTNVRDISELTALQETLDHQRRLSAKYRQEMSVIRAQLMTTPQLVAEDPATLNLLRIVSRAAQLDTVVLIQGETGTGKERIATYIHQRSPRASKNFIRVNCGAIPESLMESELFGYEPGAFSGANSGGQKGLLEQAHTGTFFLDEVSEMPVSLQVKLLRVLQERVVRRVGGKVNHSVDIRIIAASNRNLRELVAQGAFREDLFFRLDVIPLFVPPLRERQGDIRLLVAHFLQSFSRERGCTYRVATELMHAFEAYPWPGNVRELKNFVEYGVGFCEHGVLTLDLMDSRFKTASPPPVKTEKGMPSPPPGPARDTAEYDRIMQLLGRYGQHTEGKKRTASELGISLATLYRRMGQLGITARKHAR